MKLETFFKKFDDLADTRDGVKSMRELVLRLAFSGGLSGKRPTNEGVPEGWESRTIESISASISSGFACSRNHQLENGHVHLRTHNISTLGTLNFDLLVRIDPKMVDPQKASIRAGDILFNNTNSQELVGKTSLVDRNYDYGFSNHITRIRLKDGIFPGFVVFYLTLLRNSGYFARLCTRWINQAAINTDTLKEQTIPLPPLAEQKRIVAKVDELMALCDRLALQQQERETRHAALARASLARFADAPTPANLDFLFHSAFHIPPSELRKSILTLAFAGKLVPQDPTDEPAAALLEKARTEKARLIDLGIVKKEPWADKLQDATTLYDLPAGWEWTHVSDVVEKVTVGYVGPMKEQYCETGVPFLRCQNVRENRYEPTGLTFISEEFHRSIAKSTLRPGDVVVTRSGNVGVTCVIPDGLPEANCSDLVIVKRPLALVPAFLSYFINSIAAGQIEAKTVGIALTHFNTQSVAQMTVALPPLAEQRRIVAKVDELMALVDALETQLATARATAANLLSALVAELTAT